MIRKTFGKMLAILAAFGLALTLTGCGGSGGGGGGGGDPEFNPPTPNPITPAILDSLLYANPIFEDVGGLSPVNDTPTAEGVLNELIPIFSGIFMSLERGLTWEVTRRLLQDQSLTFPLNRNMFVNYGLSTGVTEVSGNIEGSFSGNENAGSVSARSSNIIVNYDGDDSSERALVGTMRTGVLVNVSWSGPNDSARVGSNIRAAAAFRNNTVYGIAIINISIDYSETNGVITAVNNAYVSVVFYDSDGTETYEGFSRVGQPAADLL